MKKIMTMFLACSVAFGLMACGGTQEAQTEATTTKAEATTTAAAEETTKAGDAAEATSAAAATSSLSGKLVSSGSTSVQPLFEALGEAFMEKNPDVTVEVQAGGSSTGFKNVSAGVTEVGNLSRELKEAEAATEGLKRHVLAMDGIAIVVHNDNAVNDITMDQIAQIFKGEISNWSELGGADGPIVVVSREAGSGTRGSFEEICGVEDEVVAAQEVNETGIVKNTVSGNPNAIGYISLGSLDDTVKGLNVDGVAPTEPTVADGTYKIARPLLSCNIGEESEIFKAFLDFTYSPEGDKIVKEMGFVPAPKQ